MSQLKIKNTFCSKFHNPFRIGFILFSILVLLPKLTFSQALSDEQQEIVKNFEAQLEDAKKIKIQPLILPTLPSKKSYQYNVTIVPLEIKYPDPVIKPLAIESEPAFENFPFYARLGYGNIKNPFLDLRYYHTDENKLDYFFNLQHFSLDNSKDIKNQKMSNSELSLGMKYRLKENFQCNTNITANVEQRKFYFIQTPFSLPDNEYNRNKIVTSFNADFFNPNVTQSGLDYKIGTGFSLLKMTNVGRSEMIGNLNLSAMKAIGNWKLSFPLNINGVLQNEINDMITLSFKPSLKYNNKNLWLLLGGDIFYDNVLKTKLWPLTHFDYTISEKQMHVFVGSAQKNIANNLHQLALLNPWLNTKLSGLTNQVNQSIYAGFKGELTYLGYEVELAYNNILNQNLFINYLQAWTANSLQQNLTSVHLKVDMDFALSSTTKIGGNIIKQFYKKGETRHLYGVNSFKMDAYAKMKFFNQTLELSPILSVTDRSWALLSNIDDSEKDIQLNSMVFLSANLTTHITKKIGIYFEGNNLLNNKYTSTYGYPSVGINFSGGVVMKF